VFRFGELLDVIGSFAQRSRRRSTRQWERMIDGRTQDTATPRPHRPWDSLGLLQNCSGELARDWLTRCLKLNYFEKRFGTDGFVAATKPFLPSARSLKVIGQGCCLARITMPAQSVRRPKLTRGVHATLRCFVRRSFYDGFLLPSPEEEVTSSIHNKCATDLYRSYNPKVRDQCVAVCIKCDHGNIVTCSTSCMLKGAR
jgi:hypothetical protein